MKKTVFVVLLFLVLFYIPFINKAVHIDDGNFIEMSKAIDLPFSVKQGHSYYFMGGKTDNFFPFNSSHPPFIPYYLKILNLITGGYKDYLMHAGFLIFPALLLFSTFMLAKELNVEPVPALMIICGNVALLPVSHNLMADGPMFSLWMTAAYLFISGIRMDALIRIVFSLIIITIAGLVAYQTFFLLPAFFLFAVLKRKLDFKIAVTFLLPVAFVALILIYITIRYSSPISGIMGEIGRGLQYDRLFNKGMSIPLNIGVSMLFLLLLRYKEIFSAKKDVLLTIVSVLLVIPPVICLSYPLWSSLWLILLSSAGLFSIMYAIRIAGKEDRDRPLDLFLLAWIAIVLFYNISLMPFGALRYIMPAIAPMAFIFLRNATKGRAVIISAILTALLGLAVAYGDYIYASSYRDFSDEVKGTVGTASDRVWYVGEWGMHYYMDRNGFKYLGSASNEPLQGDLIIISDVPKLWGPSPELYKRMKLIDVREIKTRYPIKVMGLDIKTGYYSTLWGYQPFTVTNQPVERFGIFRVIS